MNVTNQIAKHLREIHFGGNWTGANLREKLMGVTRQQATAKIGQLHSIATLVFHMNYYVDATIVYLEGGPLEASDELSFSHPPIDTDDAWQQLVEKTWSDAERLAGLIERLPDDDLEKPFAREANGSYFRCLHGVIEHCHYHTGQIAVIKTLVTSQ